MGTTTPAELVEESLGASGSRRWLAVIGLLDGFVDAEAILLFNLSCKRLQSLRWTLDKQHHRDVPGKILSFAAFRGHDGSHIVKSYIRDSLALISLADNDGLVLDLSYCVLIKDKDLISLIQDAPFARCGGGIGVGGGGVGGGGGGGGRTRRPTSTSKGKIRLMGLKLDYCSAITDQSLTALLSTSLPHLQLITFKCVRNKQFTGEPFQQIFSANNWPAITTVNVDFTSVTLSAVRAIAQVLKEVPIKNNQIADSVNNLTPASFGSVPISSPVVLIPSSQNPFQTESGDEIEGRGGGESSVRDRDVIKPSFPQSEQPPVGGGIGLLQPYLPNSSISTTSPPQVSFVGSQASKAFTEFIGAKHLVSRLQDTLNSADPNEIHALKIAADTEALILDSSDILTDHVQDRGSEYIMNLPVTCPTSEEGGVNVWTIPISLAMLHGDAAFVAALVECGAHIDVVDHLGKSPLYRAVSNGNMDIVKYLISQRVDLTPLNITYPTALNSAVLMKNYDMVRLLIENGYPLNLRCPGFKGFRAPLQVAAELPDERLLHELLDWGADPNVYSAGSWKNSAIMLAYKAEPRLLRLFIHNLGFHSKSLAAEVLAAAIAKDDIKAVELILDAFPTLLEREHSTWSYPHIQASKTGRCAILLCLFRTFTLRIVGAELKDLRRTFPLCLKHSQDDQTACSENSQTGSYTQFPSSSPAKISRGPSKGSADDTHQRCSTVNPKTRIKFWSKQSTAEAQSLHVLPMDSDEAAIQHWTESIANAYNKCGHLPIRYSQFLNGIDQNTGNTALHYATECGHLECVKLLLRYGCHVDIQNYHMQTPLHIACQENQLEIAEYLLCTGADFLELCDDENHSALTIAMQTRNDKLATIILQFWRMCRRQGVEVVSHCPNSVDSDQQQSGPLDVAIEYNRWELVGPLLQIGSIYELSSCEKRDSTIEIVRTTLASNSAKLTSSSKKALTKFMAMVNERGGGESSDAGGPAASTASKDTSDPADEDLGTDWYDLCLICPSIAKESSPLPTEARPPAAAAVAAPQPTTDSAVAAAENSRESRAKRFQSRLKSVARQPLLLFTSKHKLNEQT